MKISLIVAIDDKNGIGKNGKMPWDVPADLKRFKELTLNHPVIMGRKTFESIGRVLPGRTNIVVTGDLGFKIKDLASQGQALRSYVVNSLENAIEQAKKAIGSDEVFIVGGGQVFREAINIADKLYITKIEGDYDADTFFPDYSEFNKIVYEEKGESNGYKFKFIDLEK